MSTFLTIVVTIILAVLAFMLRAKVPIFSLAIAIILGLAFLAFLDEQIQKLFPGRSWPIGGIEMTQSSAKRINRMDLQHQAQQREGDNGEYWGALVRSESTKLIHMIGRPLYRHAIDLIPEEKLNTLTQRQLAGMIRGMNAVVLSLMVGVQPTVEQLVEAAITVTEKHP